MRPSTKACGSRRRLKRQPSSACLALVIGPNSNSVLRPKRAPFRPNMHSSRIIHKQDCMASCRISFRAVLFCCAAIPLLTRVGDPASNPVELHWASVHCSSRNVCALLTLSNHHSTNHCLTISDSEYLLYAFYLSCPKISSIDSLYFHKCCPRLSSRSCR